MSKINLYEHQSETVSEIFNKFNQGNSKILCVIPTGGGKSVVMAYCSNKLPGRTLILTHRTEILEQNSEWIDNVGTLTSKICNVNLSNKVVVAMVETLNARIDKYGIGYLGKFDNIILDEAHIQVFNKVVEQYKVKRILAFTATPVIYKKEFFEVDGVEFVKELSLGDFYDTLVQGASVSRLILEGYLVQDKNYVLQLPDFDKLKSSNSNPDGYTSNSLTNVYSNTASLNILWNSYLEICKGKKTLIFNATTKVNKVVLKMFKDKGINARSFDSVNSKSNERKGVIEWFREERDAVLIGTNVFTTGFNVTDIECVIVNRATKSLSLWIQMVGRGSRITKRIFKNEFICIDLGQNIHTHGKWSKDIDWFQHFKIKEPYRRNKADLLNIWECDFCGTYNLVGDTICSNCHKEREKKKIKKKDKNGKIIELEESVFPRAKSIINFAKSNNKGAAFAFNLLDEKIIDLFKTHKVTKRYYNSRKSAFQERVKKIYIPIYFAIIKDNDLEGRKRKLNSQLISIFEKIDNYYNE